MGQTPPAIPKPIADKIKNAWIAGAISGTITLVVTLFAISGSSILGFSAWELLDVALIFGLTFGIYKKSRTCAVLMLIYFLYAKITLIAQNGVASSGIVLALVFIYYFGQGVVGTFQYHKLVRARKAGLSQAG
jgi:serine/threonine-protein kinase